jgi:hypothetical protein
MTNKRAFTARVEKLTNGGTRTVTEDGYVLYKDTNGELHRDPADGPAVIIPDICVEFHVNNKFHRPVAEGPAVLWDNGAYEYLENNARHNPEGAAIWCPYAPNDQVGYITKFIKNKKVINEKDFCGDYFLEPGDQYFDLLKEDPNDNHLYWAIEEKEIIYEGKKVEDFWMVQTHNEVRLSHLIFMTKWVDLDRHELLRLPQEKYDEIDWELDRLV